MFGLMVYGAMGLYLLLSILIVLWAVRYSRRHGKNVKRWALGAALVMYLIPFWDWLPTVAMHKYYCATEAGFWVYKTVDQWKAENPGVFEALVSSEVWSHKKIDGKDVAIINQRINLVYSGRQAILLNTWPDIREVIDTKNHEVLARYVDFSTSQVKRKAGWSGWKIWLDSEACPGGEKRLAEFGEYYMQFQGEKK